MSENRFLRFRATFAKTAAMRYTGHLDLHRAWERAFRRAGLPLAYSQGFHPQPKINLAAALPLGITSECEVGDFWLEQDLPLETIATALEAALPPGIRLLKIESVAPSAPALQTQLRAAEYEITLLDSPADLDAKIGDILQASSLPRQRRGRDYDLRPLIEALERLADDAEGRPRLLARLTAREAATGRPEEIVAALGLPIEAARIRRVRLIF